MPLVVFTDARSSRAQDAWRGVRSSVENLFDPLMRPPRPPARIPGARAAPAQEKTARPQRMAPARAAVAVRASRRGARRVQVPLPPQRQSVALPPAERVPLPRRRDADAALTTASVTPPPAPAPVAPIAPAAPMPQAQTAPIQMPPPAPSSEALACLAQVAEVAVAKPQPAIAGPGECQAENVVTLEAVILPDARRVQVIPSATLRCEMAQAVAHWVREDVAPATAAFGSQLQGLRTAASFDCRGRNRVDGAKLSEHGRANALDVRAVLLPNGKEVGLTETAVAPEFRERLKQSACARFTTVLGPGSDGYHEVHVHLDLIERPSGYRMCQWEVRTAPEVTGTPAPPARPRDGSDVAKTR